MSIEWPKTPEGPTDGWGCAVTLEDGRVVTLTMKDSKWIDKDGTVYILSLAGKIEKITP